MTPTKPLSTDIRFQIDFDLQMVPAAVGIEVSDAATAKLFGISEDELAGYLEATRLANESVARSLLRDPAIRQALAGWDVPAGAKVLMAGDSITTYRYSYARILKSMMDLLRPDDCIQIINVARSGYTTVHALEATFTQWLAYEPDLVFLKFGVNDCKQLGGPQAGTLVPIDFYEHTLREMVSAFRRFTGARVTLITPTPVVESVVNNLPDFVAARMTWDNDTIQAYADVVRKLAGELELPLGDFMQVFGQTPDPADFVDDGLHPGPTGHERMVRALIAALN